MQTSTDYPTAYMKEKARADDLRNMLDNQIAHTARACRESDVLCVEINRLRAALEKIASTSQTDDLLWWQKVARETLGPNAELSGPL